MTRGVRPPAACAALLAMMLLAPVPGTQASGEIGIDHAPPATVLPGIQIELTAVLRNATSAQVRWNNGSLPADALVPMTNLSEAQGGGWVYKAWLPAEPDGTQVTYAINATGPAGSFARSYFLTVGVPSSSALTDADQAAWILTMVASLAIVASAIVAMYWYIALRLRREEMP